MYDDKTVLKPVATDNILLWNGLYCRWNPSTTTNPPAELNTSCTESCNHETEKISCCYMNCKCYVRIHLRKIIITDKNDEIKELIQIGPHSEIKFDVNYSSTFHLTRKKYSISCFDGKMKKKIIFNVKEDRDRVYFAIVNVSRIEVNIFVIRTLVICNFFLN